MKCVDLTSICSFQALKCTEFPNILNSETDNNSNLLSAQVFIRNCYLRPVFISLFRS